MRHLIPTALLVLALSACRSDPAAHPLGSVAANLASADNAAFADVVTRRVFSGPLYSHPAFERSVFSGNVSPDGRTMLVTVPDEGPVTAAGNSAPAVFDLVTGQITKDPSGPGGGVFSRDGKQIAFRGGGITVTGSDRRGTRTLMPPSETHRALIPHDWSPDGRTLLVVGYGKDFRNQLILASVADGSSRVLKSTGWQEPLSGHFSPDGRSIAYSIIPGDGAGAREVFVIATDGSRETQLTDSRLEKEVLGWSSTGDALLFWEWSKEGFSSVWRIPMAGGTAAGPAQRVRGDIVDADPIQMVGDRILYQTSIGSTPRQLFEVEIDGAGSSRGVPRLASPNRQGRVESAAVSPDGARIAYQVSGSASPILVIRSTATGAEREIVLDLQYLDRILGWAEDGESLLLDAQRQGVWGLYRYDPRSGQLSLRTASPIPTAQPTPQRYMATNSESSVVYFSADRNTKLVAHDLGSGAERVVFTEPGMRQVAATSTTVSPDGKYLAFFDIDNANPVRYRDVRIMPAAGGEVRTLFKGGPEEQVEVNSNGGTRPAWSPDGKYLYVATTSPAPLGRVANGSTLGPRRIWQIAVAGGEAREVLKFENSVPLGGLSVSPDGRRLYFSGGGGSPDATGEIWIMENLTPASSTPKGR